MALPLAGAPILAADLSAIFATGTGAWTAYIPTLVQSGAVTKTVTAARYIKIGRLCIFAVDLTVIGTGTASNPILIGLPLTANNLAVNVGTGLIYDTSVATVYPGQVVVNTTTAVSLFPAAVDGAPTYLGARGFTAALASGDLIRVSGFYETAS